MAETHSTLPGRRIKDIRGHRFGRLVAKRFLYIAPGCHAIWLCQCDCGKEKAVRGNKLQQGRTKSCGCRWHWRHRKYGSKVYRAWDGMIQRCENPKHQNYKQYGARGIRVCKEWHDFQAFYDDMGDVPEGRSLERVDNNGNYEKSNCRWATRFEQCRNRRTNHWLTFQGRTQCVTDWAKELSIAPHTLLSRFQRGWSIRRALTTPNQAN